MKKVILLCGMLLALTASVTYAATGVNMRWDHCFTEGGIVSKSSACALNFGGQDLICSFEIDAPLNNMTGDVMVIDLASASPTLPAWWTFIDPASCRPSALSIQAVNGTTSCFDWSNLQASMNIAAYDVGAHGPNTARIKCLNAVKASQVQNVGPGLEFNVAKITVSNALTTGAGSCGGCNVPVCLVFNSCELDTLDPAVFVLLNFPAHQGVQITDHSDYAAWQGGGVPIVNGRQGCPLAVPTRNATWGSVKALYR